MNLSLLVNCQLVQPSKFGVSQQRSCPSIPEHPALSIFNRTSDSSLLDKEVLELLDPKDLRAGGTKRCLKTNPKNFLLEERGRGVDLRTRSEQLALPRALLYAKKT